MNNLISFTTFGFITIMALGVIVAIFKMKYDAAAQASKQRAETDSSYRDLAARALKLEETNAALLSDIAARMTSLEKLLKDVA